MPVRKRKLNKRQTLSASAQAWLRGEPCGFFAYKNADELEALWNEHGDKEAMFWQRGMLRPRWPSLFLDRFLQPLAAGLG
ncbi:hypothetical protein AOQ71_04600 [Bradyrhizobium manausense]|uniref:Uncharacterized protein n=1 Tax=Bradyrhizobium manausense TaxID=989370 RepID=A0A0R3E3Q5_9BRAD|nr:hypothetical protein AOQ71_04600 [Bradyrhizobium manausense]